MTDSTNLPRHFLVFGYFGGWNSGDEAILESVRRMLGSDYPEAKVTAICTRVREEYAAEYQRQGLDIIPAKNLRAIFNRLRNHQLIIGGGQMLTGDKSFKGLLFIYLLCLAARIRGQRARMIGIGVEGVHRLRSKWLVRRIAANCQWIGCRDEYSLAMLRNAGCNESRLKLTADVVFSGVLRAGQNTDSSDRLPITIGLHHSPIREYASEAMYLDLISSLRGRFTDRDLLIVSNDARPNFDAGLLDRLRIQTLDSQIHWKHFESMDDNVAAYANSACVVSVRMHPLILSLINRVPVVGIAKSNKVKSLARRVGFEVFDPQEDTTDQLLEMVTRAINTTTPDVEPLMETSMQNVAEI